MITVLMATFNGERHLSEQLDSLLSQTLLPDRILIQDDQSTDTTVDILRAYERAHPELIEVRVNDAPTGSAAVNFCSMMAHERDDYLMLCDQDDVWLPEKIEKSSGLLHAMESQWGPDCPCLAHTDLTVADEGLRVFTGSFRENTFADYDRTTLRDQIIQNTATGCTIMYNRALANMISSIPEHMVMHDWWISLIAATFGHIDHLDDQTMLYRQHSRNQVGVTDMRRLSYKMRRLLNPATLRADIAKTYPQAREFLATFSDQLTADQRQFLLDYSSIPDQGKLGRLMSVFRLGIHKTGISRNIAYLMFI